MKSKIFKLHWVFLLVCIINLDSFAQTNIQGQAIDYTNQQMVAYGYLDLFSNVKEKIGSSKIDEFGHFEMDLDLSSDQLVVFSVNRVNAEVFVAANIKTNVTFKAPDKNTPRTFAHTNTEVISNYMVTKSLSDFEVEYEQFLQESSFTLKLKLASGKSFQKSHEESLKGFQVKNIAKSDSSTTKELLNYSEQVAAFKEKTLFNHQAMMDDHPFFKEYVNYSLATLELVNQPREEIYLKHLQNQLNFNNPAIVSFFQGFYNNIWEQEIGTKNLLSVLKKERNYFSLDTTAAKIPYLENEDHRQLALVNGLYQAYNTQLANQDMLLTLLVRKAKSDDSFASKVAENYVNKIIQYKKGVKLNGFRMLDKKEKFVGLDDLQGKFVYINFFSSWCTSCEGEMYIINNLRKKYGKEVQFVSINMDDDYKDFKTFLSKHRQFDWKFLYGPSEEEILSIFNIQTIPTYLFIDGEGNWISSNTKSPSEGISNDFDLIMRKAYQAPTRYKVWDD